MQKIRLIVLVVLLAACSPAPTATPTITLTPPPTLTPTATFTVTPSPTPTMTSTPDPLAGLPAEVRAQIEAGNTYNAEKGYVANFEGRMLSLKLSSGEWRSDYNGSMLVIFEPMGKDVRVPYYANADGIVDYLRSPESGIQWNERMVKAREQEMRWRGKSWREGGFSSAVYNSPDFTRVDNQ